MQCPKCNSDKIRTNGTTPKGTTRYRCKNCGKTWSKRPIGRPPKGLVAMTNAERKRKFKNQQLMENQYKEKNTQD